MYFILRPGHYYAGIDRPWFVSEGMVRDKLAEYGLSEVRFHRRETTPPVTPQTDPGYSPEWDEWVEATYTGAEQPIDVTKRWAWLVFVPAEAPGVPAQPVIPQAPEQPALQAPTRFGPIPASAWEPVFLSQEMFTPL